MAGWGEFSDKWSVIKGAISKHIRYSILTNNPQLLKKIKSMKENELRISNFYAKYGVPVTTTNFSQGHYQYVNHTLKTEFESTEELYEAIRLTYHNSFIDWKQSRAVDIPAIVDISSRSQDSTLADPVVIDLISHTQESVLDNAHNKSGLDSLSVTQDQESNINSHVLEKEGDTNKDLTPDGSERLHDGVSDVPETLSDEIFKKSHITSGSDMIKELIKLGTPGASAPEEDQDGKK